MYIWSGDHSFQAMSSNLKIWILHSHVQSDVHSFPPFLQIHYHSFSGYWPRRVLCPDNKLVHEQMMVEFHRAGENKVTICKPHGELVLFEQPKIQQTKMLVMCQRFGDLLQSLQNDFVGDIQGIPSSCIRVLLKPYTNFDMLTFNLKGKGKGCTFKTNALWKPNSERHGILVVLARCINCWPRDLYT